MGGKPLVPEEGRFAAHRTDDSRRDLVQFPEGDVDLRRFDHRLVNGRNAGSRHGHLPELALVLDGDHVRRNPARAPSRRSVIAVISPVPGTRTTMSRAR